MAVFGDLHIPKLVALCVSEKGGGIGVHAGHRLVRPKSRENELRYYSQEVAVLTK